MAITFDAVSSASGVGVSSLSWSHTTTTNSNRLMVVTTHNNGTAQCPHVTGVTYNSLALTNKWKHERVDTRDYTASGWYRVAPSTGTNTVVVTFDVSGGDASAGATTYDGVDQTTPLDSCRVADGATATATVDVSSVSGDLVVDGVATGRETITVGADQTSRWEQENVNFESSGGGSTEAGAATVTMSWTLGATGLGNEWVTGAVSINPVGATSGIDFGSAGPFVSAQDKTAGDPWSPVTEFSTAAGDLLILIVAKDNAASADGETSEVVSVAIGSNSFTKAKEFCNAQGAANAGATVSMWYCKNAAATTAGDTITIDLSASTTAKACVGFRFNMDNANTLSIENSGTLANDAADAGSMTLSSLNSGTQYLIVRGGAGEGTLTTYTPSTNYKAFEFNGASTTGGTTTNQYARGEYRIVSGVTSDSTDPTTSVVDQASVMVAFKQVAPPSGRVVDFLTAKTHPQLQAFG